MSIQQYATGCVSDSASFLFPYFIFKCVSFFTLLLLTFNWDLKDGQQHKIRSATVRLGYAWSNSVHLLYQRCFWGRTNSFSNAKSKKLLVWKWLHNFVRLVAGYLLIKLWSRMKNVTFHRLTASVLQFLSTLKMFETLHFASALTPQGWRSAITSKYGSIEPGEKIFLLCFVFTEIFE